LIKKAELLNLFGSAAFFGQSPYWLFDALINLLSVSSLVKFTSQFLAFFRSTTADHQSGAYTVYCL
jgi:hypothetical protein